MKAQSNIRTRVAILAAALAAATLAVNPLRSEAALDDPLAPPAGNVEAARWHAEGYQIYIAVRRVDDPTKLQWTLKAPDATLYNGGGKVVGKHYGGPTWESNNGSKVIATRDSSMDSPDPNAIAWLLLRAVSHEGSGMFSSVSYIQRIDTVGGKAPAAAPTEEGATISVPYTATYVFFEAAE